MKRNKLLRATALTMGAAMSMGVCAAFAGCGGTKDDALKLMTDELNGLFNPFYSTAGSDMGVVGETQIGMVTTDAQGNMAVGKDEACVVLDWQKVETGTTDADKGTTYDFVIKNDILFSDGVPLTMNDILFNMYVYLDPAFSGSSTMYSTEIIGLKDYRNQRVESGDGNGDEALNSAANERAVNRLNEIVRLYQAEGRKHTSTDGTYELTEAQMHDAINQTTPSVAYKNAIAKNGAISDEDARKQMTADYDDTLKKFKEELQQDYNGSKDSYTDPKTPYPSADVYISGTNKYPGGFDEIVSFMYTEGYVTIKYHQEQGQKEDRNTIDRVELNYNVESVNSMESAIDYVYKDKSVRNFDQILYYWASGSEMQNEFIAKAKDVILHERVTGDALPIPNISGIESLGHKDDAPTEIEITNQQTGVKTTYKIAHDHDEQGVPTDKDSYDVLRIKIKGIDPKAEWNFSFSVAPYHYYSDPSQEDLKVDIKNNKFGVRWADFDFHSKVIQGDNTWGESKNKVPLGAGAYVATDKDNSDKPTSGGFIRDNIVYYKANPNFLLGKPNIEKMQYRVIQASNALNSLQQKEVDFVSPQFTTENSNIVKDSKFQSRGFKSISSWQLGYGYIGVNAAYVKDINLRKAIMAAMNEQLALGYYEKDTCMNIYWNMSACSWAYPRVGDVPYNGIPNDRPNTNNGHDYASAIADDANDTARKNMIQKYMNLAGKTAGDPDLKYTFTIAGASLTEHPCYAVFLKARELLNELGWDIEVKADTNALTKLATGSLEVWAAAWGSALDPDMYQVYHKNSTATSVLAWGYKSILNESGYEDEREILNKLSDVIDEARTMNDRTERTKRYKTAMGYVLDLAVELPIYQRQVMYALNTNVIDEDSLEHDPQTGELLINPYTSPLAKIWKVKLK